MESEYISQVCRRVERAGGRTGQAADVAAQQAVGNRRSLAGGGGKVDVLSHRERPRRVDPSGDGALSASGETG
ncbi:hypothetical protein GCM10010280_60040 [Streptomyces pilosus]|uniref:Uncharacterized protein n=1 Tax=Streptomyces pilosus TaxID=28893 RepID=A0A918F5V5_9ACTN|nr:hypothetical protein GCM10010280_60040 [Streptomyces pilosus]